MSTITEREVLLRAEGLRKILPGEIPVTLVHEVSLDIYSSEFVAIVGPSGCGKSSLLYMLGLLDTPTAGKITLNHRDTIPLSDDERADLRLSTIGFVFQFHFLLPEFTVLENVLLPMQRLARLPAKAQLERAKALLSRLGLANHLHKLPKQLSGGESQRVAIARALANDPVLIFADEPTGNLDSRSGENVQELLFELAREPGKAVVAVTHSPEFAERSDRVIRMRDGGIDQEYAGRH